jgi:hypothetical protein
MGAMTASEVKLPGQSPPILISWGGECAPFEVAIVVLCIGFVAVNLLWTENKADEKPDEKPGEKPDEKPRNTGLAGGLHAIFYPESADGTPKFTVLSPLGLLGMVSGVSFLFIISSFSSSSLLSLHHLSFLFIISPFSSSSLLSLHFISFLFITSALRVGHVHLH